jgi:hypothetical protein
VAFERLSARYRRVAYLDRVRDAVVYGAATDFAIGTEVGGPSCEACVKGRLDEVLDEAGAGLRGAGPIGAGLQNLGVTYGPYLGRRCPRSRPRNCDTFGIDIAFRHAATRVEAVVGSRAFRLRIPVRALLRHVPVLPGWC